MDPTFGILYTASSMNSWRIPTPAATALLILIALPFTGSASLAGQQPEPDGLRVGIMLGGISLVNLMLEYRWGDRSVDMAVGTWAFQDVSVSVVGKQYLGPAGSQPFFGLGLWGVAAFAPEGTGSVMVLRAPIGVDWRILKGHNLGAAMSINRGLWVRRTDPDDDTPLNQRVVPLPGVYYKWTP